jgi:hypothetical protein
MPCVPNHRIARWVNPVTVWGNWARQDEADRGEREDVLRAAVLLFGEAQRKFRSCIGVVATLYELRPPQMRDVRLVLEGTEYVRLSWRRAKDEIKDLGATQKGVWQPRTSGDAGIRGYARKRCSGVLIARTRDSGPIEDSLRGVSNGFEGLRWTFANSSGASRRRTIAPTVSAALRRTVFDRPRGHEGLDHLRTPRRCRQCALPLAVAALAVAGAVAGAGLAATTARPVLRRLAITPTALHAVGPKSAGLSVVALPCEIPVQSLIQESYSEPKSPLHLFL